MHFGRISKRHLHTSNGDSVYNLLCWHIEINLEFLFRCNFYFNFFYFFDLKNREFPNFVEFQQKKMGKNMENKRNSAMAKASIKTYSQLLTFGDETRCYVNWLWTKSKQIGVEMESRVERLRTLFKKNKTLVYGVPFMTVVLLGPFLLRHFNEVR